jgi:hypothetical protein
MWICIMERRFEVTGDTGSSTVELAKLVPTNLEHVLTNSSAFRLAQIHFAVVT